MTLLRQDSVRAPAPFRSTMVIVVDMKLLIRLFYSNSLAGCTEKELN